MTKVDMGEIFRKARFEGHPKVLIRLISESNDIGNDLRIQHMARKKQWLTYKK